MRLICDKYHDLIPLFTKTEADRVPTQWYVEHAIPLLDNKNPLIGCIYSISDSKLQKVLKWIEENLSKGFIKANSSSCTYFILVVKKKDSSLRLWVDYQALNDITMKDWYPLPRIEESLNQIRGAQYFTCLDLHSA